MPTPTPAALRWAEQTRPKDTALALIYERSCFVCHSNRASKAPLTGFALDWQPRLGQGMPTLVAHVRDGFQAMPPRGFCNDCSDVELQALIDFMIEFQPTKE